VWCKRKLPNCHVAIKEINSYPICIFKITALLIYVLYSIALAVQQCKVFLQKYLGKVAELDYIHVARLYYSDACHYISCCPTVKVLHMPKTKFNYRVFKKNKTYISL